MLPCRSLFAFFFSPCALQSHVAMFAPPRIFPEATLGEILLRAGGEDELLATINTQQDFVNKLGFHKSPRQVLWIQYTTPPARALLLHTKRFVARYKLGHQRQKHSSVSGSSISIYRQLCQQVFCTKDGFYAINCPCFTLQRCHHTTMKAHSTCGNDINAR